MTDTPDNMTGAELQTLREACGLSREELGSLASVQPRTIKHWENGRAGVPADVAMLVQALDDSIEQQAKIIAECPMFLGAVLVRYSSIEDHYRYSQSIFKFDTSMTIPMGAHGAVIGRARQMLRAMSEDVRVVWLRPEAYEAWHQTSGAAEPFTSHRLQYLWAVEQVSAQAIPHKADQPPADQA